MYEKDGEVLNDTWTAPETSKYRIYSASGGGGGAAWWRTHNSAHKEYNGGRGDWYYCDVDLNAGDVVYISTIGGGGAGDNHQGGNGGSNGSAKGDDGGDTRWYVKNPDGSIKYELWLAGGGGAKANNGSYDGDDGYVKRQTGLTLVSARMPRWVLPMDFCKDYVQEYLAYVNASLANNASKLPKDNTGTYAAYGCTFKVFWTKISTFSKYMTWKSTDGSNPPLDPVRYGNVIRYMNWTNYSSVPTKYRSSTTFIAMMSTTVKVLNSSGEKLWDKTDGEYYNALNCVIDDGEH